MCTGLISGSAIPLPDEIFLKIFSLLSPKELTNAARVCEHWNSIQKTDFLWKRHCLRYLNDQKLTQLSWKENYRLISNWMAGRMKSISYPPSSKSWRQENNFLLLKDGSALEVFADTNSPLEYHIRNCANSKRQSINLATFQSAMVVKTALHETTWTVLDSKGKVFVFNILTLSLINSKDFSLSFTDTSSVQMLCNGIEVIIYDGQQFSIWNFESDSVTQLKYNPGRGRTVAMEATKKFIIVANAISERGHKILAINRKKDPKPINLNIVSGYPVMKASDSYFSLLDSWGALLNYKEVNESLERIHTSKSNFFDSADNYLASFSFYRNWLLASIHDKLKVFDMESGLLIASFGLGEAASIRFCTNLDRLLIQKVNWDCRLQETETYSYALYDFSTKNAQLKEESHCTMI